MHFITPHAICAASVVFLMAVTANGNLATIGAMKDSTIFANNPNNSAGGAVVMFSGTDSNASVKRGLIAFDVADNVPAGATITNVQLTLGLGQVAGNVTTGTATISLYRLLADWGEGTAGTGTTIPQDGQGFAAGNGDATWDNRFFSTASPTPWTVPGGDFSSTVSASTVVGATVNNSYTWLSTPTLVSDVQGWLNNPSTNFGWLLENNDEADIKTFRAFYTREEATADLQPSLQVTYTVPEPVGWSLVVLSLLGLIWRRPRDIG